jgi:hypothetical protein
VYLLHKDDLVKTLEGAPKRLTGAQVHALAKAVALLGESARDVERSATAARFGAA